MVLSALVGWSKIVECNNGSQGQAAHGTSRCTGGKGGSGTCKYLEDVERKDSSCDKCGCIKGGSSSHLGRGCTRCSGGSSTHRCSCSGDGCTAESCKCALAGKCCKCCCKGECGKCSDKCSCMKDDSYHCRIYHDSYQSAYGEMSFISIYDSSDYRIRPVWSDLKERGNGNTPSHRRHQCARIFLGSVCLIWSGITYMHWTGKWDVTSPYWNNHILDGSGLDDGTLSQWLQALGFPKAMLNDKGPENRLDKVINIDFVQKFYLGFADTSSNKGHGKDKDDNTFRNPAGFNFGGFIHAINKGAFGGSVFQGNGTDPKIDQNKLGPLFKLYILSCAYFTGLQKKSTKEITNTKNPKTIREILYWLSALPYSQAYPEILKHGKDRLEKVLKKPEENSNETPTLAFLQEKRPHPITVHEYNLFAHFQAVTQYCPLVLIGIQGGLHSTTGTKEPPIHSLYANTECGFTYPTVSIQAYNQVVHYIRALFYQLYFLRKQCAVKVTCGGKWRECRYGSGVLGKGVVSWMCLGCNPMEHDRHYRVGKVKEELGKVVAKGGAKDIPGALKEVLEKIGEVVVQLGNAQEALEGRKGEEIKGVQKALGEAKAGLEKAKTGLEAEVQKVNKGGLNGKLGAAKNKLEELTRNGRSNGKLGEVEGALGKATNGEENKRDYSSAKDKLSEAIKGVRDALEALKKELENESSKLYGYIPYWITQKFIQAIEQMKDICNSPKCSGCTQHSTKCGKKGNPTMCSQCGNMTTTGVPSPLQAFLEDRLPGFSCNAVPDNETPEYPSAASHLGHCGGSGQCCPLPMGFRNQFYSGGISDMTG
ncbi:variant erythrocyte surface antigen-1 alpha subunit [Babesia bovis T2Bo]|uniref:Variant erythrocyte surface antigen-1, alpha subunit n=1 Tax=Babesia bovis TaxID=5865 RepID=A7ARI0_BABBO|nr:variant erythrocyte surface antigen-1 alpha subunit [Babesia bovis T2Bo]EDO07149.1 variant erythrocyte surface antigen-1 alpha subunit [Babesia bovis T2Bo]|eukprot:XP_001610717.1 variant erythrocyte surface antigen-1, alpha subunit [Babesia bovis T2Bo]